MRYPANLHTFRVVALSDEHQKEFKLPRFICAEPDGQPFLEGQVFRAWLIDENLCQSATADKYLKTLLPFLTFLWFSSPPLRYTAPFNQIRSRIRDYLKEKLGCAVRPHRQGNFVVTVPQPVTQQSVRLCLVVLKRFYEFAISKGWYTDANPLLWSKRLMPSERHFIPAMPPESGLTLPDRKRGRMPDTYFCFRAGEWEPRILDDATLPGRLIPGFNLQRDQLIARILFQSGARISEVLGLTMGDWRHHGLRDRALAINKGSLGERVKEIWWSSETAILLRRYVENERREFDPSSRGLDELPDNAPVFVTDAGTAYTYFAFYYHWRQACTKTGVKVHPHQARHWFVTTALRRIQTLPDSTKREAQRQALISYMKWKNPETIRAYDHHLQLTEFSSIHATLAQLVEGKSAQTQSPSEVATSRLGASNIPREMWDHLNQLLDED